MQIKPYFNISRIRLIIQNGRKIHHGDWYQVGNDICCCDLSGERYIPLSTGSRVRNVYPFFQFHRHLYNQNTPIFPISQTILSVNIPSKWPLSRYFGMILWSLLQVECAHRGNISYPGKIYTDPDQPEIKLADPTQKYSSKCSLTPDQFQSGPVRPGETLGFGLPHRSLLCSYCAYSRPSDWWNKRFAV